MLINCLGLKGLSQPRRSVLEEITFSGNRILQFAKIVVLNPSIARSFCPNIYTH